MTWADRLLGWIRASIQEYISPWSAEERKKIAIQGLNGAGTGDNLLRVWKSIPARIQADPDVRAAFDQGLAAGLPNQIKITQQLSELAEGAGKLLTDTYMHITPATPETALAAATSLIALDTAKDIAVGIAGLTVETASAGQIDTFTDFFKFLRAKTGYGGPMTMLMKAPIELGVISPLSKYLHSQYRDAYLRGQAALILATKGHISEEQMRKAFSYEGYPEWSIDAIVKDRWRELRLGEIAWALNDGLIDELWLDEKLKYALYSPDDRPVIIRMIREKYLRTYRDRVATQLRNHFKEGYISAQDFRVKLAAAGVPLIARDMIEKEANFLFTFDMNADQIAAWETQYLKTPSMTDAELRALYSSIIVDPARVEPRIAKMRAQRLKTPALPKPATQGAKISSKPSWSAIMLDFLDTGKLTPETIETSAGTHTIVISTDGYEPYSEEFAVKEGEFVEIYAVLVPLPELAE